MVLVSFQALCCITFCAMAKVVFEVVDFAIQQCKRLHNNVRDVFCFLFFPSLYCCVHAVCNQYLQLVMVALVLGGVRYFILSYDLTNRL